MRSIVSQWKAAALFVAAMIAAAPNARAEDWTMWGRTASRNMYAVEKDPPVQWDASTKANIKWEADLGSKSYGNPVISNGIVYVGTNNEGKRDPSYVLDAGVLMAFREADGQFLWQRHSAKLPTGRVNDWPGEGLCSTVYSEASRIWYCTNRCEVVCLDVSPGGEHPSVVWSVNMMAQLGVFPHNMTSCATVAYGDLIYIITGNGVDETHKHVVAPKAPAIVCFNKNTGAVVWTDNSPGQNVLHGQWASPAIAQVNGRGLVICPLGDGWIYAYDANTGKIVWKFDSNPKASVYPQTRNELIATPVVWENRLYIANGQDPEHGEGPGHLWCIDITKEGDISAEIDNPQAVQSPRPAGELIAPAGTLKPKGLPNPSSGVIWHFDRFDLNGDGKIDASETMHRSISTVAIDPATGLLFEPDFSGYLHCLDARTGKVYWSHDMEAAVWGSALVCDGKVYLGDEGGNVRIFQAARDKKLIAEHDMGSAVYCSPVYSNGTLYIMTREKLYAIGKK